MTTLFLRDKFTWLMYLVLGFYAYLLNGFGPVMPFLRAESGMSYLVSSLHFSAFAVGILLAGFATDRVVRQLGRYRTFWLAALGMAGSTIFLLAAKNPVLTIGSSFLMGSIGTMLLVIIPAALADRHPHYRAVALSEANVMGSLCSVLAPVLISTFVRANLSWRYALIVPLGAVLILGIVFRQIRFPEPQSATDSGHADQFKLPGLYWIYWGILLLVVSVEFCLIFWAATFLEVEKGLLRPDAAFSLSLFLAAMVLGRWVGSRLSHRFQSEAMILGSLGIGSVGFLLHWLIPSPEWSIGGLFAAGLGVANLYPQTLSLAVGTVPAHTDQASARASLASGTAILSLPLLLGGLADLFSIRYAYIIIAVLLALAIAGIVFAGKKSNRD